MMILDLQLQLVSYNDGKRYDPSTEMTHDE